MKALQFYMTKKKRSYVIFKNIFKEEKEEKKTRQYDLYRYLLIIILCWINFLLIKLIMILKLYLTFYLMLYLP